MRKNIRIVVLGDRTCFSNEDYLQHVLEKHPLFLLLLLIISLNMLILFYVKLSFQLNRSTHLKDHVESLLTKYLVLFFGHHIISRILIVVLNVVKKHVRTFMMYFTLLNEQFHSLYNHYLIKPLKLLKNHMLIFFVVFSVSLIVI